MNKTVVALSIVGLSVFVLGLAAVGTAQGQCCGKLTAATPVKPTASPEPTGRSDAAAPDAHKAHAAGSHKLAESLKEIDAAIAAIKAGRTDEALAALQKARMAIAETHKALAAAKAPGVVNDRCPIMGTKIDPNHVPAALLREFNGQKVGFCCAGCPAAWDKLTDAEKETKLQAVGAPKHAEHAAFVNTRCPIMGTKIDPAHVPADLTREFHGKKVAFCCGGCPAAWDKLADAQKEAKLAAVTPPEAGQ